jgi:hypothetical protein
MWAYDSNDCIANYVAIGYDCASAPYGTKTVCAAKTSACKSDVAQMDCSNFYGGMASWPASCTTFWNQYQ